MSEIQDPTAPQLTFEQFSQLLSSGSHPSLIEAYAQAESPLTPPGLGPFLQALSRSLGLDITHAADLFPKEDSYEISLEEMHQTLRRFCDSQQPADLPANNPIAQEPGRSSESSKSSSSASKRFLDSPISYQPPEEHFEPAPVDQSSVSHPSEAELKVEEADLHLLTGEITEALKSLNQAGETHPVVEQRVLAEDPLVAKLRSSIRDFEAMKIAREQSGENVSTLVVVLKTLKTQLGKLTQITTVEEGVKQQQLFHERCTRTIRELFQYYSNQLRLLGKTPSFELIQHNSQIWNVSKFVRFCQDFALLGEKHKRVTVKVLDLATIKTVFARNSFAQKEMSEEQFTQSLGSLAGFYYDSEYDAINGTELAAKSTEEKRETLYRFLQLDKISECLKRAKGFGLPFFSKTDNRVPENDLAQKYKYRPRGMRRSDKAEDWRSQNDTSKLLVAKPSSLTPPRRAPADAIVANSSKPTQVEKPPTPKCGVKARNPFTWKALGELNPEEVMGRGEDFDLSSLLAGDSSDDEMLKKQYPMAASHPVLPPKPPSPRKLLKATLTKPPPKPLEYSQKSKDLSLTHIRKEKEQLMKTMKVAEAQQERGNKVLSRLRQSTQY